jgi:hypothetical protein
MITEELIDELVERFHGWVRNGEHGILRYLNSAHEILMTAEAEQTIIFNETIGELPLLVTTTLIRRYEFPNNVWRVGGILVKVDNTLRGTDYEEIIRISYKNCVMIGGIQYAKVPYVKQWDYKMLTANTEQPARIMFTQDPGSTTDYYYRLSYRRPTQILSEAIQPDIAQPQDINYLIPATAKLMEGAQNGNYDEARQFILSDLKPKLWRELNSGVQGEQDNEAVDRGF